MNETVISIKKLREEYTNVTPLEDVNAEIHRGESQKTITNMQLVFEEIFLQTLVPPLSKNFLLSITVEYLEENDHTEMRLVYDGENLNPLDFSNEISRKLIDKASSKYKHEYKEGKNYIQMSIV